MNRIRLINLAVVFCLLLAIKLQAQIESQHLSISYNKTSNLIFPYAVKSVDRGNASVIAQKAKGAENILQLKAATQNFSQTNLSVITSDGKFYSFVIDYADEPSPLNLSLALDSAGRNQTVLLSDKPVNESELKATSGIVKNKPAFLYKHTSEQGMHLLLQSIYLSGHSSVMWLVLQLYNTSMIDYKAGFVRFFLKDRKRSLRTAVQENELQPLTDHNGIVIHGESSYRLACAFQPFTIPSTKELIIQIGEQNGGRTLILHINHAALLKARLIAD